MPNFDPSSVTGLIGLWDFRSSDPTGDTGLDDGFAQDGHFHGGAQSDGDYALFDGNDDYFDVEGEDGPFDMDSGTIEVQFVQDQHVGSSPDVLVNRGEAADVGSEGFFSISVLSNGAVQVIHCMPGGVDSIITTPAGTFSPGDEVNVKYTWDEDTGAQLVVDNLTTGSEVSASNSVTGLTMNIGDNDDESFTFGARESDDGTYDQEFDGSIDYVAIYEEASAGPDGVVDGEDTGEIMGLGYDDANGPNDQGGDMITDGDDIIEGNGGDDLIDAADGDDIIDGGSGEDLIFGDDGDDTISGGTGADVMFGDAGEAAPSVREIFQWSEGPGFANNTDAPDFTQDTGTTNITFTTVADEAGVTTEYETTDQVTTDLDADVGEQSSMESVLGGSSDSATYQWESDQPIENVEFRVNDIDGDGRVIIRAYDADGNPVEVELSNAGSGLVLSDNDGVAGNETATSFGSDYGSDDNPTYSVLVTIPGPVSRWELVHEEHGPNNSGINVTDIAFDTAPIPAQGDDTFIISSAEDGAGDVVIGGNGGDDTADNDVLDLRGAGTVTINQTADATDAGATTGTVRFEDGSILEFDQIETILADAINADPTAVDDTPTTDEGDPIVIDVLANDTDPDGDDLEIDSFTQPNNGTVTQNPDGTLTYTPDAGFTGNDVFTYTVIDGNGGTSTASVDVLVEERVLGPVDGEETGEDMGPGYNDEDGATDGGGDQIDGDDGNDDTILGNGGDDTIDSGLGDDTVLGGSGSDTFDINDEGNGIDNDEIIGGEDAGDGDVDVLDLTDISDDLTVTFDGEEQGEVEDGTDTTVFAEIEQIQMGSGDDSVEGNFGDEYVAGNGGDDVLNGNDGNDTLLGGAGEDTINGGADDDVLDGGADNDTIIGGDGSDVVTDMDGDNVINTSGSNPLPDDGFPDYGPLPGIPEDTDPTDDMDVVTTGAGNDTITTGDDDDLIDAGNGDNVIDAGIDNDTIVSGSGDDEIIGGEGADSITSGAGNDTIYGGLGDGTDAFNLLDDPFSGPFGPDPDEENGRDFIDAGAGNDLVFGADDRDTILGGSGNDTLDGGIDNDEIEGGSGNDSMIGGQGADTLSGQADADTFTFATREDAFGDVIDGGTSGIDIDTLDLTGLGRFEIVGQTTDADGDSTSGTVNFIDLDGNIEGSLQFSEIEQLVICFTPGSRIATPQGEVSVENLNVGDRVITRDDGVQEISWIGRKKLSAADLRADRKLRPVLIKKGALGNNQPERDMTVSPNHRMLMANNQTQVLFDEREVLIAAKYMVGQPGIYQMDCLGTEYIHVMFEHHQVILGDGSWTESFQPGDHSLAGIDREQREEIFKLFPDLQNKKGRRAYGAARQSLKAHEAKMLRKANLAAE